MKYLILPLVMALSGCAVQPQNYDLSTSAIFEPVKSKKNISNIEIINFKYEPNIHISQNTISYLGCFRCQEDGSSPGVVFSNTVSEIVQAEVKSAFQEVLLPTKNAQCKLGATIHMAAWDIGDGDSIVDLTYTLIKDGNIKYIKRIRGEHDSKLFEASKPERLLAKASRKSVSMLLTDSGFLSELDNSCPST